MKKSIIISAIILAVLAAFLGLAIAVATRLALLDMFFVLTPTAPLFPKTNILVLGVDDAFGHRSDTLMLVHVDPEQKSASVVSLPRDTLAVLPGRGLDKINHAYAFGGAELSRQTVERLFGIEIPYYITIDLGGIVSIIDSLGGLEIDVEKKMYYIDYAGGLYIDLKPGRQRLSGKDVLGYLRFRHSDGDFKRISRQQHFLRALAGEMLKKENLFKSPGLFFTLLSYINTNLNSRQTLGLGLTLKSAYELNQLNMTTLPGSDLMVDGIYYLRPDEAAIQEITRQYLAAAGPVTTTALSVEVNQN
jgi:LCP family protein required for cell wall assembly